MIAVVGGGDAGRDGSGDGADSGGGGDRDGDGDAGDDGGGW